MVVLTSWDRRMSDCEMNYKQAPTCLKQGVHQGI
jgi:hypothetical protein